MQELGLFSTHAVGATKDLFWSRFSAGKRFAKQSTMWDMLFVGMRSMSSDEGILDFLLQMVVRFVLNLFIGIFAAMVSFLWSVWSVITAYRPDAASAVLFFLGCALVAVSFLASFMAMVLGVGTVAVLGVAKAVQLTLEGEGQRQHARIRRDN
jgi:hypothetical protein